MFRRCLTPLWPPAAARKHPPRLIGVCSATPLPPLPCLPANDFCTFCSGSLLHLSPHVGPRASASVDDGGISSRGRIPLWAPSEASLFRQIQLAICNSPPALYLRHPPAPFHPLWSCCLRRGRYLKSIFLQSNRFFLRCDFFCLSFFRYGSFRFCNVAISNWLSQWFLIGRGGQEDIWDMIAVVWPRCLWELMTHLVTGSMWQFLSKRRGLQFGRTHYCSAQKLNCCWFSPAPLHFILPSAWSLFPHCLLWKTPLFSKCLVKGQSGRRRHLKSLSRVDWQR